MTKTQNSVQLIGYLAGDPVVRKAVNGNPYTKLRLATDYYRKKPDGTVVRKVTWHTIMTWNHLAESLSETFTKGSHVLIQGAICNGSFSGKNGEHLYYAHVRASKVVDLDR